MTNGTSGSLLEDVQSMDARAFIRDRSGDVPYELRYSLDAIVHFCRKEEGNGDHSSLRQESFAFPAANRSVGYAALCLVSIDRYDFVLLRNL